LLDYIEREIELRKQIEKRARTVESRQYHRGYRTALEILHEKVESIAKII